MSVRSLLNAALLMLGITLAGCSGPNVTARGGYAPAAPQYAPTHYYAPPGPADDPWGPYINEAAARFGIPATWIRAVMAQESGGEEQAVSPTGAMGLMQVEPATYQALEAQYGFGDDPFNPHDNVLAGAAYIKQMYTSFGAPGFLAAYNAGPNRLEAFLTSGTPLPDETVNYLAAVTPNLGTEVAFSGPLATYASSAGGLAPTVVGFATGCDVNAAYDPDHPCTASANDRQADAPPAGTAAPPPAIATNAGSCDADTAYDPASPCTAKGGAAGSCNTDNAFDPNDPCHAPLAPVIPAVASATVPANGLNSAIYDPAAPPGTGAPSMPAPAPPPAIPADWSVQVGAFASPGLARAVADGARAEAPEALAAAEVQLPSTTPFGGRSLYRAQLTHLTAADAIRACAALNRRQLPCVVLPGA